MKCDKCGEQKQIEEQCVLCGDMFCLDCGEAGLVECESCGEFICSEHADECICVG